MKKIFVLLILALCTIGSLDAQVTKEGHKISYSNGPYTIWRIDIGFNNFLEEGSFPQNNNYSLNNFGSRYISAFGGYSFGIYKRIIELNTGLAISAHNFMFEGNQYITQDETSNLVSFANYATDFQQNLDKSKLVVYYLEAPISLRINIGNKPHYDKIALDLGAYIGYRFSSYASIRPEGEDRKQRTHGSYNLNNWRYGLEAALGIGEGQIFARYDMNNLFNEGQMPELNVLYFGLRIWGSDIL